MPIFLKKFLFNFFQMIWRLWYKDPPKFDLEHKHISSLKVLLNRKALLEQLPQHSVGAELGVEYGLFSLEILNVVQPQLLHLVDLWKDESVKELCFAELSQYDKIKLHDSSSIDFLKAQESKSLDWVYIDTDHSYALTLNELVESARVVKDDGLICGHDYTIIASSGIRQYGVVPAVHEFCIEMGYEMVFLTHESNRHLSFALKKMS